MNQNISILIVAEDPVKCDYLKDILEREGYILTNAYNNAEAINSIKTLKPSLVISDISLPNIDGYQICRSIKADHSLKDIPIVLLIKLDNPMGIINYLECEADSFIIEPINKESLVSTINRVYINTRKNISKEENINFSFHNREYSVKLDYYRVLEFLFSSYDGAFRNNQEIHKINEKLEELSKKIQVIETDFNKFIETDTDAIVILNKDAIIRYVNPAAEKLFGLKSHELLDKILDFPLVPGETIEVGIMRKNNHEEPLAEMRVINIDWKGEKSLLAHFHDITKRKKVENALREGVKREAMAYDQGKIEILDSILHNIGNAINSVAIGIGTIEEKLTNNKLTQHLVSLANAIKEHQGDFSDYVKNDPQGQKVAPFIIFLANRFEKFDEDLYKTLTRVHERTEHISDIIRTQKIISKRGVYRKNINLKEGIENAISLLQDTINRLNIEVTINCDNAPGEINIQESEFHQMLVNLIKNSIEAIGDLMASGNMKGTPFINIVCYSKGNTLLIQVIDNGIGIERDKLEIIFRAGYTTKKTGSGFGLHSIANFVKGVGGNIVAISDGVGTGATMEITIPLS